MDITIVDCATGETVTRPMTEEELAQRAADTAAAEQAAAEALAAADAREAARVAAVAHAQSLGFTDEMIAAMGLGG